MGYEDRIIQILDSISCPFCGSTKLRVIGRLKGSWVECTICGANGPDAKDVTEARKKWERSITRKQFSIDK